MLLPPLSPLTHAISADFDKGTHIINAPGAYKLCEDITFRPDPTGSFAEGTNPADFFQVDFSTGKYDERAYGLGFFAALVIASADVQLYLNGHTIEQSREHQMIQRFYANIELASAPFIAGTGPHEFVGMGDNATNTKPGVLKSARNFQLFGPGVIGRSAHHGIHGNENQKVTISGVTFQDFEVAAVGLNKVSGLEISDCIVIRNSREVDVLGMFSAARFIRPYGKWLKDNYPRRSITFANGETKTSTQLYDALTKSINDAYRSVVDGVGELDPMYKNQLGIIEGPW